MVVEGEARLKSTKPLSKTKTRQSPHKESATCHISSQIASQSTRIVHNLRDTAGSGYKQQKLSYGPPVYKQT